MAMDPTGAAESAGAARRPAAGRRLGLRALLLPVAVGLGLRLWNLPDQIVGDDELHAVRAALEMPIAELLVTWRQTDHSLPLSALYRVWLDFGGELSGAVLRVPPLLGSLLLLLVAPRWLAPLAGARVAMLWAWALAVAPMLVAYGNMVRSYSLTVALATCALLALGRYWNGDGRRFAAGYAACGALAIFFHLGSGPIVMAPLGLGVVLFSRRGDGSRARAIGRGVLVPGLAVAALALAFLLPGAVTLRALIESKAGAGGLDFSIVGEVLRLHAGSAWWFPALVFWGAALAGPWLLWARDCGIAALLAPAALVGQSVGLAVLAPELGSPTLAARAMLVTLPFSLLAFVAALDAGLVRRIPANLIGRRAGLAVLGAVSLLASPYADRGFWTTSFRHHDDYLIFTRARPKLPEASVPDFYRTLRGGPPGGLVELPWHPFWGFGHAVPAYQERHGRSVVVANGEGLARSPGLGLRTYRSDAPRSLLASGQRYAVVHLDLAGEERVARGARGFPDRTRPHPAIWQALRNEGARSRRELDSAWGPPDYEDGMIAVWDLERIRSS